MNKIVDRKQYHMNCAPLRVSADLLEKAMTGGSGRVHGVQAFKTAATNELPCNGCGRTLLLGAEMIQVEILATDVDGE